MVLAYTMIMADDFLTRLEVRLFLEHLKSHKHIEGDETKTKEARLNEAKLFANTIISIIISIAKEH